MVLLFEVAIDLRGFKKRQYMGVTYSAEASVDIEYRSVYLIHLPDRGRHLEISPCTERIAESYRVGVIAGPRRLKRY